MFDTAVAAVSAEGCLPSALPAKPPAGRTLILAVGKAAPAMAAVAAKRITGQVQGLVVAPPGHFGAPFDLPEHFECIEAGHPVPNEASLAAASRAIELARELGPDDRLLALVSGGGSALLALPSAGISLADKQAVTRALLRSGATIGEINCVRQHLSQIKGGRLARAAAPAEVITLVVSDVPGDDPALVASGPTLCSRSTAKDAKDVIAHYGIEPPDSVKAALAERIEADSPAVDAGHSSVKVVARARNALDAAADLARQRGFEVVDLGDDLQGEARILGGQHAELARRLAAQGRQVVLLSGGEATVRVGNPAGRGGRNLEYLLALALGLEGAQSIHAIACDTDGIDGTERCAGALLTSDTLERAQSAGLDPQALLDANDSYLVFDALGDLVLTGPTRTNVNDFRAILIEA